MFVTWREEMRTLWRDLRSAVWLGLGIGIPLGIIGALDNWGLSTKSLLICTLVMLVAGTLTWHVDWSRWRERLHRHRATPPRRA